MLRSTCFSGLMALTSMTCVLGCGGDGSFAPDGEVPDGAMTDGAMTDGAMTDGAMTDGAMTDGAMTDGDGGVADGGVADGGVADGGVADGAPVDGGVADGAPVDGAPVDAVVDGCAGDADGDGVCDTVDTCDGFDDAIDGDGDGTPDACDCDSAGAACLANGGSCVEGSASVACTCPTGRYGAECAGECDCGAGSCNDGSLGDGACTCPAGTYGARCDTCECSGSVCDDGVTGDGSCTCDGGRFGATCSGVCDCQNGGTCDDGAAGSGACTCPVGFYGADCAGVCDCRGGVCDDGASGTGACECAPRTARCLRACVTAGLDQLSNLANGSTRSNVLGQSFTTRTTGSLTTISFEAATAIDGTLALFDGPTAASPVLASEAVTLTIGTNVLNFSTPPRVVSGNTYFYRFTTSGDTTVTLVGSPNPYAGGQFFDGVFRPGLDMVFSTWVAPCP